MSVKSFLECALCAFAISGGSIWAQNVGSSTISGVVRDPSGAVLPGVTVEVASPALIEKSRSAVTDGYGAYRIIDLRPGVYTVTFTAPGFSVVRREALDLPSGFSATVNADLQVGTVQEQVTVQSAAPVVDTQDVEQQKNFAREVTQNLPTGMTVKMYAELIPGTNYNGGAGQQDVGGGKSEFQQGFTIHGGRADDFQQLRDGMFYGTMVAAGNWMTSLNPATVSEVTVLTGGQPAQFPVGGTLINVVARDGGNSIHGTVVGSWTSNSLQASNVDAGLRARGLTTGPYIRKRHDIGGGIGGPIIRDKVWWFASTRTWDTSTFYPGNYYNKTPGTLFYTPDLGRPAYEDNTYTEARLRLTWQASSKDKIVLMGGNEWNCNCPGTPAAFQSPETFIGSKYRPNYQTELTWTRILNSHLVLEVGGVFVAGRLNLVRGWGATTPHDQQYVFNALAGYGYGNVGYGLGLMGSQGFQGFGQTNETAGLTYVSGSHTLKTGLTYMRGWRAITYYFPPGTDYTSYVFLGTTPSQVVYYAAPQRDKERQTTVGWFVQDQWKIKRLTLNLGLRYDYLNGSVPAVGMPAGPWIPARSFPAVNHVPDWKNWDPRIGGAFDLFGNGKTALKAFVGRFVQFENIGYLTTANSPVNLTATTATRAWKDTNGDYIPEADELGPLSNPNFGKTVQTTTWSNDILHGNRPYYWMESVGVEQQLWRGAALNVGYFRRSYGNFRAIQTLGVTPQDYTPYCITAPANPLLPGGGGNHICGVYDINPAQFTQVNKLVTLGSHFGHQSEVFTGIDVIFTARLKRGIYAQAGLATGSDVTDNCYLNNLPNVAATTLTGLPLAATASYTPRNSAFCHISPPWSGNTQLKAAVVYPLPWKLQASAIYQNLSPIPTPAQIAVPNSMIAPSLGRNLSACGTQTNCTLTQLIDVLLPNTYYTEPRVNQLDLRLSRTFSIRDAWRIQPNIDLFNVTNSNAVESINTRLGPSWNNVTGLLDPRVLRFGVNIDF